MDKEYKDIKVRNMVLKKGKPAMHQLGDIGSSEYDDLIYVQKESEDSYIGAFEEGCGFVGVVFKKEDVRPMTKEEVHEYNGKWHVMNNTPLHKVFVDYDGYVITEEEWEDIRNDK